MGTLNSALAIQQFTNARFKVDTEALEINGIPLPTLFQLQPGLLPEELIGIFVYAHPEIGLMPLTCAKYHPDYPGEVIICTFPIMNPRLYYSPKTGKVVAEPTRIPEILVPGPIEFLCMIPGLSVENLTSNPEMNYLIKSAEHVDTDPEYIHRCTMLDDSVWYYNVNTGRLAVSIAKSEA